MRIQRFDWDGVSGMDPRAEGEFVTYADHHAAVVEAVTSALAHGLVEGAMVERERIRQAVEALPEYMYGRVYRSAVLDAIDGKGDSDD
jgi:hypothetical protein